MKFIHIADIHWNAAPDSGKPWSQMCKRTIKHTFQALISYVEEEQIPLLLIAGDLFNHQPLSRDLRDINSLFMTIPNTRVVMIAGEHDYISPSSSCLSFNWNQNVTFLSAKELTSVYFPELNLEVHGFSYHCPQIRKPLLDHVRAPRDNRFHILLVHGGDETHLPFTKEGLRATGFDYIALGHSHKPEVFIENMAAYPGSLEPVKKTEFGSHGYIEGEIGLSGTHFRHIPFAQLQYISLVIHITPEITNLELQTLLKEEMEARGRKNIYRFRLKGICHPMTNFDLESLKKQYRIIDVINQCEPDFDYELLYKEHKGDMIGLFIDRFYKPDMKPAEKKALIYGLKALMTNK